VPNIGPMELIVVLIIALLVLGPKKLPEVGRSVGRGIREFKASIGGEHDEPDLTALRQPTPDPAEQAVDAEPVVAGHPRPE
jgi:sec-independent protein translocase protein TatA